MGSVCEARVDPGARARRPRVPAEARPRARRGHERFHGLGRTVVLTRGEGASGFPSLSTLEGPWILLQIRDEFSLQL